jgi:hypothetical protein
VCLGEWETSAEMRPSEDAQSKSLALDERQMGMAVDLAQEHRIQLTTSCSACSLCYMVLNAYSVLAKERPGLYSVCGQARTGSEESFSAMPREITESTT